jgi:S1 RNA binding domain protein
LTTAPPLEVGSIVEGTVTGITNFGAFVLLPNGQTGLVHISEVADSYVKEIRDFLQEQDTVRVKVLSVDPAGKIALSIKQADPDYRPRRFEPRRNASFEDRLNRFLRESEEKLSTLKRATDSKRGGRGTRR